jgi:hypothetical protein
MTISPYATFPYSRVCAIEPAISSHRRRKFRRADWWVNPATGGEILALGLTEDAEIHPMPS